ELGLTAAELPPETKNSVSHRGRACRELRRLLAGTSG
ncbi:MAG TPA: non-canonical purine NTP pyrophosphatase, partial [Gammaproteobacteria bacterium]